MTGRHVRLHLTDPEAAVWVAERVLEHFIDRQGPWQRKAAQAFVSDGDGGFVPNPDPGKPPPLHLYVCSATGQLRLTNRKLECNRRSGLYLGKVTYSARAKRCSFSGAFIPDMLDELTEALEHCQALRRREVESAEEVSQ